MRVAVESPRHERPGGPPRERAGPRRLQSAAALSPEQAIALQRAAGNAAVVGLQWRLQRVSKAQSATLDGVSQDWQALLTAYRASAPGIGGAAPALGPLDFTQPIVIPEPTSRAEWISAWRSIWQIVEAFKREVARLEAPLPKLQQQVDSASDLLVQSDELRKMLAEYGARLGPGPLPPDLAQTYGKQQLWDKVLVPRHATFVAKPEEWKKFSEGRLLADDTSRATNTTRKAVAQQSLATAGQAVDAIRKPTPLVTMNVCGHVVKVDRGLRATAGATTAGWVAVDALTVDQMKYNELAARLTQEHAGPAQQAARIRAIVNGARPAGATAAEVSIAAIWFGPEFMRNPDSFGMGLMMLDLMERGATYGRTHKPYTWANVLSGTLHAGESIDQWRLRKDPHGALDAGPILELDQWSGKFPMALKGSEALGSKPMGALPNIVHSKEASLLVHWMQARGITTSAGLATGLTTL